MGWGGNRGSLLYNIYVGEPQKFSFTLATVLFKFHNNMPQHPPPPQLGNKTVLTYYVFVYLLYCELIQCLKLGDPWNNRIHFETISSKYLDYNYICLWSRLRMILHVYKMFFSFCVNIDFIYITYFVSKFKHIYMYESLYYVLFLKTRFCVKRMLIFSLHHVIIYTCSQWVFINHWSID